MKTAPVCVLNALLQDICAKLTYPEYIKWRNAARSEIHDGYTLTYNENGQLISTRWLG